MKKEVYIIAVLLMLFGIFLFVNMRLTGRAIFEEEDIKIELIKPEDFQIRTSFRLEAYCDVNLSCKEPAFYYSLVSFDVIDGELIFIGGPKNVSDYELLCDDVSVERNIFIDCSSGNFNKIKLCYQESPPETVDRFSCVWKFEEGDYEGKGDSIMIMAMVEDKNDSTIYSNHIYRYIGERTKWIRLFERIGHWDALTLIILVFLILGFFVFWLGNYVLNKLQKGEKDGYARRI